MPGFLSGEVNELAEEANELSAPEAVLIIELLDAVIPFTEESRYLASENDRFAWHAHDALRRKLKAAIGMSFFDRAKGWLDSELRREREAATAKLFTRLAELMREPNATRRSVREGFVATVREMKERRQSPTKPLS
jgi:hypothetical protein